MFTHAAVGRGEELDSEIVDDIKDLARARRARLFVVQLLASEEELVKRIVSPERRKLMKELDPAAARLNAHKPPFDPGTNAKIVIDTTEISENDAASMVLSHIAHEASAY